MKATMHAMFLAVLVVGLSACSPSEPEKKTQAAQGETAVEHAKKHLDPTYVCPMHSSVIRDKPGNCPICGMELVPLEKEGTSSAGTGGEKEILFYRHPMNPEITSETPMKDDMGMDFIPVYAGSGGPTVTVSSRVIQNMGVRTAEAKRGTLWRPVSTVGYVDYHEGLLRHIHTRAEGWIERLPIRSTGERIAKGELLFEFYSPTLVNAQEEYLQALNAGNRRLAAASRERLLALDVPKAVIEQVARERKVVRHIPYRAPRDEVVAELGVREGMFVTPSQQVMSLGDLSAVWLVAEVFDRHANWVKVGQPARVRLPFLPGRTWEGEVDFIYPALDERTRTLKVRLRFDNPDEMLKPNMYASVTILGGPKHDVVHVPAEAVIRTGSENRVILAEGEGRFRARKVVPGIETNDRIEIKAGLEGGERVVTSGQFLIDSEASLKASVQRLSGDGAGQSETGSSQATGQDGTDRGAAEPAPEKPGTGKQNKMDRDAGEGRDES